MSSLKKDSDSWTLVCKQVYKDGRILFICTRDRVRYNVYMSHLEAPEIVIQNAGYSTAIIAFQDRLLKEEQCHQ